MYFRQILFRLKVHTFPLLIILFFSLFASQKLFTDSFYTSHDGEGHVIRMEEFDEAFSDGQIPVRIAKRINHGTGYPFFNFSYPLIYYLGEGIHSVGFSYVATFKILFVISVILGGVTLYFFCLYFFSRLSSLTAGIFYTIAPYKFLNMYVRGNVAEALGLSIVPLLLFSLEYFLRKKPHRILVVSLALTLLTLSHNITAMVGFILGVLYIVFRILIEKKLFRELKLVLLPLVLSLLLTAFFLVPVLVESSLTRLSILSYDYKEFFPSVPEVIYSPWGFGGFHAGPFPGKMSPQIGLVHLAVFTIAVLVFMFRFRNKENKRIHSLMLFFIVIFVLAVFLSIPYSRFLWDRIGPLQMMQQPWRFIGYATLAASVAAAYIVHSVRTNRSKLVIFVLLLAALLYTNRNHIRVNQYYFYHEPHLKDAPYDDSTTSRIEHLPTWSPIFFPAPRGDGDVFPPEIGDSSRTVWKSNYHSFHLNFALSGQFRDNTVFFPGWTARLDAREVPILYTQDPFGRLRISVPKGVHTAEFFFGETWYRIFADMISAFTFISLVVYLVIGQTRLQWIKQKRFKK